MRITFALTILLDKEELSNLIYYTNILTHRRRTYEENIII